MSFNSRHRRSLGLAKLRQIRFTDLSSLENFRETFKLFPEIFGVFSTLAILTQLGFPPGHISGKIINFPTSFAGAVLLP